jgi:hypothetical protein
LIAQLFPNPSSFSCHMPSQYVLILTDFLSIMWTENSQKQGANNTGCNPYI